MRRDPIDAIACAEPAPRVTLVGPEPITELLTWHPAAQPPDADMTVLLWVVSDLCDWSDSMPGYWTGEAWRLQDDSEIVSDVTVTHWSEPHGPDA